MEEPWTLGRTVKAETKVDKRAKIAKDRNRAEVILKIMNGNNAESLLDLSGDYYGNVI